jgi:hypothetical protein
MEKPSLTIRPNINQTHGLKPRPQSQRPPAPPSQNFRKDESMDKQIKLTQEEVAFLYYQLLARKNYFEGDMLEWATKKDVSEVQRCAKAVDQIEKLMLRLL